ncbi:alkaline phosphatase family protein [Sulfurisphaera javensis]|uniref:Alkaline phosphatase family protein n=1 Tax=Sulfurisphaera javensis TaxID=2049879 RepID=A0AAT9GQ82_9CREN
MSLENSIYSLSVEVKNAIEGKGSRELKRDKVLFILVDGLGYNVIGRLGLKEVRKINSVFPTITVTVLTTILTATPPGVHGILGWRVLDKENGRIVNLLEENANVGFAKPFLTEEDVILAPALRPSMRLFKSITKNVIPYFSPWDAITQTNDIIKNKRPRFVFLYLPFVDAVSHYFGPYSSHTLYTAQQILELTRTLAEKLSGEYSVIITSDHGHIPVEGVVRIDKEILHYVDLPPYGDHRNLMLLSKKDPSEYLTKKYNLTVLNKEKAREIMGGDNIPDYVAIPNDNKLYMYWNDEEEAKHLGSHGGLSKEEMEIPLFIY